MAEPIIFTITEAGKQAAISASSSSPKLQINLSELAIGSGQYTPTGSETSLASEIKRHTLVSGDAEIASSTLRFSSAITVNTITDIHEIGLFTDDDILFAVASSNTPLFTAHPDITFAVSFGLSLEEVGVENITVTTDPNGALSLVIMENHLAAPDPHPQYLSVSRFQLLLQTIIPLGYQYTTHTPINPKPVFDELMGIDTFWRRITGKIMVSTDPNDNHIKDVGMILGQKGMTDIANQQRPQVYPLQTTHLFERYDPSTVIETQWVLSANKSPIAEGGAVRFTVSANNVLDGQILNWTIKEGVLNTLRDDINSPEKTESGTVILNNGLAVINFTTTPDDNEVEVAKYVRLTVGAPANRAMNVPISDAGFSEIALHISQSTAEGIDLAEYYKAQSGQYPTSNDTVRFIVDAGVDIIALDTQSPAITEGVNWPSNATIIIENRGRILGRGGDGGRSAYYAGQFRDGDSRPTSADIVPAVPGQNGGLAVRSQSTSISIENYGVISGGGGGGGGMGAWIYVNTNPQSFDSPSVMAGGGGGSGGGAPLGKRSPNEGTWQMYLKDPTAKIPRYDLPDNTRLYHYFTLMASQAKIQGSGIQDEMHGYATPASQYRNVYLPIKPDYSANYFTDFDGEYRTMGCSTLFGVGMSAPLMMSQNATVEVAGKGGYGGGDASGSYFMQLSKGADLSVNHGGNGGAFGEGGEDGVIGSLYTGTDAGVSTTTIGQVNFYSENAVGGLAGYIKEGNVTINNLTGGTTKGR